jgi:dTDP-4-dehydrorhamnose 3,5-epimerase
MIKDVLITPLDVFETTGGSVMHAMKNIDRGFVDFGEAYFSNINYNSVRAWKRHKKMTLNLVVPVGEIKFILFDNRNNEGEFQEVIISRSNYCRLTIPPMVWMGFQGLNKNGSTLLNIANIKHDPNEVDRIEIEKINYDWSIG